MSSEANKSNSPILSPEPEAKLNDTDIDQTHSIVKSVCDNTTLSEESLIVNNLSENITSKEKILEANSISLEDIIQSDINFSNEKESEPDNALEKDHSKSEYSFNFNSENDSSPNTNAKQSKDDKKLSTEVDSVMQARINRFKDWEDNKFVVNLLPQKEVIKLSHSSINDDHDELDYDEEGIDDPTAEKSVNLKLREKNKQTQSPLDEKNDLPVSSLPNKTESGSEIEDGEASDSSEGLSSSDGELLDDEECEEGEIKDLDSSRRQQIRTICKFFTRGHCTWGDSCRFIHPGVNDKGNYALIERPLSSHSRLNTLTRGSINPPSTIILPTNNRPVPSISNSAPPVSSHPVDSPTSAAPPNAVTELPVIESAWERGLKQAKELRKKAIHRKETEPNFEEKRLNLSVDDDKENFLNSYPPVLDRGEFYDSLRHGYPPAQSLIPEPFHVDTHARAVRDRTQTYHTSLTPEKLSVKINGLKNDSSRDEFNDYHTADDLGSRYKKLPSSDIYDRSLKSDSRHLISDNIHSNRSNERLSRTKADEWSDPWLRKPQSNVTGRRGRSRDKRSRGRHSSSSSGSSRSSYSSYTSRSSRSRSSSYTSRSPSPKMPAPQRSSLHTSGNNKSQTKEFSSSSLVSEIQHTNQHTNPKYNNSQYTSDHIQPSIQPPSSTIAPHSSRNYQPSVQRRAEDQNNEHFQNKQKHDISRYSSEKRQSEIENRTRSRKQKSRSPVPHRSYYKSQSSLQSRLASRSSSSSRSRSSSRSSYTSSSESSGSADSDNLYRDISKSSGKKTLSDPKSPRNFSGKSSSTNQSNSFSDSKNNSAPKTIRSYSNTSAPAVPQVASKAKDPLKTTGQKSNIKLSLISNKPEKISFPIASSKKRASNTELGSPIKKLAKVLESDKLQSKTVKPISMELKSDIKFPKTLDSQKMDMKPSVSAPSKTKKSTSSRREELLQQLKAVESAIQKKRSKLK